MKRVMLFGLFAAILMSCAQPRTSVITDDQSGSIVLKVQPGSAEVFLNDSKVGKAREFDGTSAVMKVAPGMHTIRLVAPGYQEYTTKRYISDSQEVIEVNLQKE